MKKSICYIPSPQHEKNAIPYHYFKFAGQSRNKLIDLQFVILSDPQNT